MRVPPSCSCRNPNWLRARTGAAILFLPESKLFRGEGRGGSRPPPPPLPSDWVISHVTDGLIFHLYSELMVFICRGHGLMLLLATIRGAHLHAPPPYCHSSWLTRINLLWNVWYAAYLIHLQYYKMQSVPYSESTICIRFWAFFIIRHRSFFSMMFFIVVHKHYTC